jgi:hypothetical protein
LKSLKQDITNPLSRGFKQLQKLNLEINEKLKPVINKGLEDPSHKTVVQSGHSRGGGGRNGRNI